ALAINNSNVVVGAAFVDSLDTIYHAFVAFDESLIDLNSQLDATGAGWTLIEARGISDSGQIVGTGTLDGTNRVFLLNPLPTTVTGTATDPNLLITAVAASGNDLLISFTT